MVSGPLPVKLRVIVPPGPVRVISQVVLSISISASAVL
jgi:hypothetical protein